MADTTKIASTRLADLLERNRKYAAETHKTTVTFTQAIPRVRESRGAVIVLSCIDPRLDLKQILGVHQDPPAEAVFLVLNPGGRAHVAITAIAGAQAVNHAGTILVIHHSDCGMIHVSDEDVKKYLLEISPEDKENIEATQFGEISTKIEDTIKEDVAYLRNSPWVRKDVQVHGLKYDLVTGLLEQIV